MQAAHHLHWDDIMQEECGQLRGKAVREEYGDILYPVRDTAPDFRRSTRGLSVLSAQSPLGGRRKNFSHSLAPTPPPHLRPASLSPLLLLPAPSVADEPVSRPVSVEFCLTVSSHEKQRETMDWSKATSIHSCLTRDGSQKFFACLGASECSVVRFLTTRGFQNDS